MKNFKVILLGPSCSGKTCLLNYFANKNSPKQTVATLGVNLVNCLIKIKGEDCKFQIWDTPGVEKTLPSNSLLLVGNLPKLAIIFYELYSEDGENQIQKFINLIRQKDQNIDIAIIGTKLEKGVHKNQQNIEKRFSNYKIYNVSTNIKEIFLELFTLLYDKFKISQSQSIIESEIQIKRIRSLEEQKKIQKQNGFLWFCGSESD